MNDYKYENILLIDPIKISRQVDGTAGDTSDEDGSDISDDQYGKKIILIDKIVG